MFKRLWRYVKNQVVADLPNEFAACADCGARICPDARFRSCRRRLAEAAWLDAHPDAEDCVTLAATAEK
ncbi:MAG: hypothetical protein U1E70_07505 [Acetobacteraceae bacterium]|nr:hypothetical protein [Pseudomonadota bacterium]